MRDFFKRTLVGLTVVGMAACVFAQFDDFEMLSLDEEENAEQFFLEAENLSSPDGSWVRTLSEDAKRLGKTGTPWPWWRPRTECPVAVSDLVFLQASEKQMGTASATIGKIGPSKYRLHVRYHDQCAPFVLKASLGGKVLADATFDGKAPVQSDNGNTAVANSGAEISYGWIWGYVDFKSDDSGPLVLSVKQTGKGKAPKIDCFLLAGDTALVPKTGHFHKLYLRFTLGMKHPVPSTLNFGKITVDKLGARYTERPLNEPFRPFRPGETSGWVEIGSLLDYGPTDTFQIHARALKDSKKASFTVEISTNESPKGVIGKISLDGEENKAFAMMNRARFAFESGLSLSQADLERAKAVGEVPGRKPRRFRFASSLGLNLKVFGSQTVSNEMEAFSILGIGDTSHPVLQREILARNGCVPKVTWGGGTIWDVHHGCPCSPDFPAITNAVKKVARDYKRELDSGQIVVIGVMDEPQFGISSVLKCKSKTTKCSERFPRYLAEQGVHLEGENADQISRDPKDGERFYWSARYRNAVLEGYCRAVSSAASAIHTNLRASVNIATELVFEGNITQYGADPFGLYGTGALTFGETEDWANMQRTYQHCSYQADVMRAAGRRRQIPFDILNVLGGRSAWEIEAKGYSEIGHGASSISFFRYGPDYAGMSDSQNSNPEIYAPIKRLTHATGVAEDMLLDNHQAKGDAALLLSETSDIYEVLNFDNVYGKERMLLSLLLLHSGIRTDILSEDDVEELADDYPVVFVTDAKIRRALVDKLVDYVKAGGTLVLGPGALMGDEAGKPLKLDEKLGIKRRPFELKSRPGMLVNLAKQAPIAKVGAISAVCGMQPIAEVGEALPADLKSYEGNLAIHKVGKGRVVLTSFFAGLGYLHDAKPLGDFYSHLDYPQAPRDFIHVLAKHIGLSRRLYTDHPLVEATLKEGKDGSVIILSNWSGKPIDKLTVTLRKNPGSPRLQPQVVSGKLLSVDDSKDQLKLTLSIGAGDYILLKSK